MLRGLPRILRDDLAIPLLQMRRVRKKLNFLASPLTAWMVFVFTLWIWHVPSLYNEAVVNEPLHFLEHMMFIGAAVLFWWTVIDPIPSQAGALVPAQAALSLHGDRCRARRWRRSSPSRKTVMYTYYESVPRLWGLSAQEDQMIAGLVMWIPGAGIYFTALTVIFFVMLARDNERMLRLEGRPVKGPRRW